MDLVTVKSLNGTTFKVHNYSSEMSSSSTSKPQPLHSETRVISNSDTKLQLNNISITPGDKVDVTDIDSGFENDRPAPGGIVYKNVVEAGDFMIIHKSFWPSFIKGLSCSYCKQNRINVKVSDAEGFVKRILSKCESCDKNLANVYTSPKVSNPANHCSQFALNMQISDSLKSSGCGDAAAERLVRVMENDEPATAKQCANDCQQSCQKCCNQTPFPKVPMEFLGTMRDLVQWFDDNNCRAGRAQPLETDPSEIKDDNWQWPAFGKVELTENSYVWIKSNVLKALEDQADHNKKNPPNVLFKSLIKALIGEDQLIKTSASHIPVRLFSAVQNFVNEKYKRDPKICNSTYYAKVLNNHRCYLMKDDGEGNDLIENSLANDANVSNPPKKKRKRKSKQIEDTLEDFDDLSNPPPSPD